MPSVIWSILYIIMDAVYLFILIDNEVHKLDCNKEGILQTICRKFPAFFIIFTLLNICMYLYHCTANREFLCFLSVWWIHFYFHISIFTVWRIYVAIIQISLYISLKIDTRLRHSIIRYYEYQGRCQDRQRQQQLLNIVNWFTIAMFGSLILLKVFGEITAKKSTRW